MAVLEQHKTEHRVSRGCSRSWHTETPNTWLEKARPGTLGPFTGAPLGSGSRFRSFQWSKPQAQGKTVNEQLQHCGGQSKKQETTARSVCLFREKEFAQAINWEFVDPSRDLERTPGRAENDRRARQPFITYYKADLSASSTSQQITKDLCYVNNTLKCTIMNNPYIQKATEGLKKAGGSCRRELHHQRQYCFQGSKFIWHVY